MKHRWIAVSILLLWFYQEVHGYEGLFESSCIDLASLVPERLATWVVGFLTLQAVVFSALGQAQPLTRLVMPTWNHIWPTITISCMALAITMASCLSIFLMEMHPTDGDSLGCDVMRVLWAVTPAVIGTAGGGVLILIAIASWTARNDTKLRDKQKSSKKKIPLSIPPTDSYGNGTLAVRSRLLTVIIHSIWSTGFIVSAILITLHGDVLNGLLAASGIIAVWSNTWLPDWNASSFGGGQDTLTINTVGNEFVEINIVGENYDQAAYFIQKAETPCWTRIFGRKRPGLKYRCRIYGLANAHASVTDFKGDAFRLETYMPAISDMDSLADIIVDQTESFRNKLFVRLSELSPFDSEHRGAFTALVASVVYTDMWEPVINQRTRLRALAVATTWLEKLVGTSGGQFLLTDNQTQSVQHNENICPCPIHRWARRRPLHDSVKEEARHLLGPSVRIPTVLPEHADFARQLWTAIKTRTGSGHANISALISIYLVALQAKGAIDNTDVDYFPVFDLEIKPFDVEDFASGCSGNSCYTAEIGKPRIDVPSSNLAAHGFCSTVNSDKWTTYRSQREKILPFHPKAILHVAVRVLWRAIQAQLAVWLLMSLRLLTS